MNLALISLGCEKNRMDSELFLGVAKKYNLEIVSDLHLADIIVVNTCGFIESAKKEAIDTILEVCDYKQNQVKIVAMGCLVERYLQELKAILPEVDFYFPICDYEHIDKLFNELTGTNNSYKMDYLNRVLTTSKESVYIRIAEGCDNKCAYCAIPLIRGPFRSRPFDDIIAEARHLASLGAKEITLIAQDTTRYGTDFLNNDKRRLSNLLHEISLIETVKWVRVLYLYPDEITLDLLEEMKNNDKVVKYFDIPIQHASNRLLKLMNRRGSKELIRKHITAIREAVPGVIVRTTLIVGFPTETAEEFNELLEFVKEIKFERLGCFTYSKEEDTASFNMEPKVNGNTAKSRYNKIMAAQQKISYNFNQSLVGKTYEMIIDGFDTEHLAYIARNYMFAPDDVDGCIYLYSDHELKTGEIVTATIVDASLYELYATINKQTNQ